MFVKEKGLKNILITTLYVGAIFYIVIMVAASFWESILFDEAFSLRLIQHSFPSVIRLTAIDVHPPLYYLILKSIVDVVSMVIPSANVIVVGRIVSVIPYILLLVVSITKIKRNWGSLCSAVFAFCIVSMPQMLANGVEIRMYSWGLLFVTMAYLYSYDIILDPIPKNWVLFITYSLMAAYTHYFSLVAVMFVYIFLFIWIITSEKSQLKNWFLYSLITVLAYLPWLYVFIQQLAEVSDNYWIEPITIRTILTYGIFPMGESVVSGTPMLRLIIAIPMMCIYFACCFLYLKSKKEVLLLNWYTITGFALLVGTVLVGIILSIIIRPIFMPRYMIPALGALWICFSISLSQIIGKRRIYSLFICWIFIVGIVNGTSFILNERIYQSRLNEFDIAISTLGANDVILSDEVHVLRIVEYLTENPSYFFQEQEIRLGTDVMRQVFENTEYITSSHAIEDALGSGKTIWFFDVYQQGDFLEKMEQSKFTIEEIAFLELEIPSTLYKISS